MYLTLHFDLPKVGVGMSMEGIEQNPVAYDLMAEMAFQRNPVDVKVMLCFFMSQSLAYVVLVPTYSPLKNFGMSEGK